MNKPTPRPWMHEELVRECQFALDMIQIMTSLKRGEAQAEANAAHIVKCVNMHEELVDCVRQLNNCVLAGLSEEDFDEEESTEFGDAIIKANEMAERLLAKAKADE